MTTSAPAMEFPPCREVSRRHKETEKPGVLRLWSLSFEPSWPRLPKPNLTPRQVLSPMRVQPPTQQVKRALARLVVLADNVKFLTRGQDVMKAALSGCRHRQAINKGVARGDLIAKEFHALMQQKAQALLGIRYLHSRCRIPRCRSSETPQPGALRGRLARRASSSG